MAIGAILSGLATSFFGSSSNGKGIVGSVSDVVDKWNPSDATKHSQNIENLEAGDKSQESARAMEIPSHDSWFDILVDGLARLVRPVVTYWIVGGLIGWWAFPETGSIDPIMMNIIWTVLTFWFGARTIVKDIPAAMKVFKEIKALAVEKLTPKKKPKKVKKEREYIEEDDSWDGD